MMAEKARLMGDFNILNKILSTNDPKKQKSLGRKVKNWDEDKWIQHREQIVIRGNMAKFG